MKRMNFHRPTSHYDERLLALDEKICQLARQRRDISEDNPGYPPFEVISEWANKYDLYEDYLKALFGTLRSEQVYRPRVEPANFQRHVPVMKMAEEGGDIFTLTFIRQYENATVLKLDLDTVPSEEEDQGPRGHHRFLDLFVDEDHDCRTAGSSGSKDHHTYEFIIAPPLPGDVTGYKLTFRERNGPFGDFTGPSVTFEL